MPAASASATSVAVAARPSSPSSAAHRATHMCGLFMIALMAGSIENVSAAAAASAGAASGAFVVLAPPTSSSARCPPRRHSAAAKAFGVKGGATRHGGAAAAAIALRSSATSTDSSISSSSSSSSSPSSSSSSWFPTNPADALVRSTSSDSNDSDGGYDDHVRSAFVRHVVCETQDMIDLAMQTYLRGGVGGGGAGGRGDDDDATADAPAEGKEPTPQRVKWLDPFGRLANDLSSCPYTRTDGGKVGWIDNPRHPHGQQGGEDLRRSDRGSSSSREGIDADKLSATSSPLIPPDVVSSLFERRPKGGDVLKIHSKETGSWHLIRVDDVAVEYVVYADDSSSVEGSASENEGGGSNKVITNRSKLKGLGVAPVAPRILLIRDEEKEKNGESLSSSSAATGSNAAQQQQRKRAETYHVATTGCQMNVADSERLSGVLEHRLHLRSVTDPTNADVVILNTCTIRDHAEQKVYDALGPIAAKKRRGDEVALIVAGCVAQQEGEALMRRVPEVDLVMGPQYVDRLDELLADVERGHQVVATDPTLLSEDLSRPVRGHAVRGWVNVIHGCNEHCTYCVVPGVRGVEQSRSMESILNECMDLGDAGYKEVTLLGQNIDAYGRDMQPKRTFAELLRYLNEHIPDGTVERIRYVTSHPRYFSDRVIDAVSNLDKVMECFHMPFQSGDDGVLKDMRRGYTQESYKRIIDKIRKSAPDASICGDVIVGFPGETEEAFQHTLDLMDYVKFDNLNTFAYSPRPNTEAALRTDQVPDAVKADRLQRVQRLAARHGLERSERYVGRTVEVLVEDRNPRNVDQVMGRTRQGRQVFFDGDVDELRGRTVDVDIVEARTWSLVGERPQHVP